MNKKTQKALIAVSLSILMLSGINILHGEKALAESTVTFPEEIFNEDAYRDLPEDAKTLVRENYERTEKIILTEKNKEPGKPYLNPRYTKYLGMSAEEKAEVFVVPETYVIDFQSSNSLGVGETFPSRYDLRNVNGKSYITSLKNQNELGICWAFASIEQIESYLMLHDDGFYADPIKISSRQMDYGLTRNALTDFAANPEAMSIYDGGTTATYRDLGGGGNYFYSSSLMTRGLSLVDENAEPWKNLVWTRNELTRVPTLEKSQVLNYGNSLYEVNATIDFPIIPVPNLPPEAIKSYTDSLKALIMEYGGAHVGTQAPNYSCSATNSKIGSDGLRIINPDGHCVEDSGHAMQVIGWDDNYEYEYKYCAGSGDYSGQEVHNYRDGECMASAETVTGKGAWLLRNSWGNIYSYAWLAYSATQEGMSFATDVTKMSDRNWDNVYSHNPSDNLADDSGEFGIDFTTPEKIQKIKFQTKSDDTQYIALLTEEGVAGKRWIGEIRVNNPGYYTIDLSNSDGLTFENKNIIIELIDNACSTSPANCSSALFVDSVEIFTKNQSTTPSIKTENNEIVIPQSELVPPAESYKLRPYSTTKNILSNSVINYKLFTLNGEDVTSDYVESIEYNIVATNDVLPKITVRGTIPEGIYKLKAIYGTAESVITVAIGYAHIPGNLEIHFGNGDYDATTETVDNVTAGMLMDDFINTITVNGDYYVSNIEDTKVRTGAKIKVYDFENHLLKEITIIVRGDVDGDGVIDLLDYAKIRKHIMGTFLNGVYSKAADYNNDGLVNVLDYVKMYNNISSVPATEATELKISPDSLTIYVNKNEKIVIRSSDYAGKIDVLSLDHNVASVSKNEFFADNGRTEEIAILGVKAGVTKIKISSELLAIYSTEETISNFEQYINIVVLDEPGKGGDKKSQDIHKIFTNPEQQTLNQTPSIDLGVKTKLISGNSQPESKDDETKNSLTVSEMFNIILSIVVICETVIIIWMIIARRHE